MRNRFKEEVEVDCCLPSSSLQMGQLISSSSSLNSKKKQLYQVWQDDCDNSNRNDNSNDNDNDNDNERHQNITIRKRRMNHHHYSCCHRYQYLVLLLHFTMVLSWSQAYVPISSQRIIQHSSTLTMMSSSSSSSSSFLSRPRQKQYTYRHPLRDFCKISSSLSSSSSSSSSSSATSSTFPAAATLETSLCIIPPDEAWDDIQRARHTAHDSTFYSWPPAIRLFHPFIPKSTIDDEALDIAKIIELYDIKPFNVTLDHLLILPNLEVLEDMEEERRLLPKQSSDYDDEEDEGEDDDEEGDYDKDNNRNDVTTNRDGTTSSLSSTKHLHYMSPQQQKKMTIEEREVQDLIKSEERKGKQKLLKRLERERMRKKQKEILDNMNNNNNNNNSTNANVNANTNTNGQNNTTTAESDVAAAAVAAVAANTPSTTTPNKSPRQILYEQQKSKQKFNGPCVLCLEPDEESQIQLQTLREILRKKLFKEYDPFSPSSICSNRSSNGGSINIDINISSNSSNGNGNSNGNTAAATRRQNQKTLLPKSILRKHGLLMENEQSNTKNKIGSSRISGGGDTTSSNGSINNRRKKKKQEGCTYRPLIVLGQFSTVSRAVDAAKRLQRSWEPLTFEVTDLQMVSTMAPLSSSSSLLSSSTSTSSTTSSSTISSASKKGNKLGGDRYNSIQMDDNDQPIIPENREYDLRKQHGTASIIPGEIHDLSVNGEYGCDAMIMLVGEEGQLTSSTTTETEEEENIENSSEDDDKEDKILELLMTEAGTPGGDQPGDNNSEDNGDETIPSSFVSKEGESVMLKDKKYDSEHLEGISEYIADWLNDDEDYDEGATVVIGRTQFFMGDSRQYTGMPASSTIDGKDKKIGENISGSARRRGAVHRQGDRWNEGDFGSKAKDHLP